MILNVKQVTHIFYNKKKFNMTKLDELMEEALGIKNFTEEKIRLTRDQMQMVIGLLDVALHLGEQNGGSESEKDKTDSGKTQVQKTDGVSDNRLQGERERPDNNSGLDDLRSVQEVQHSPDVSNIQPD